MEVCLRYHRRLAVAQSEIDIGDPKIVKNSFET